MRSIIYIIMALSCGRLSYITKQQTEIHLEPAFSVIGRPEQGIYFSYVIAMCASGDRIYILDMKNCEVVAVSMKGEHLYSFGTMGQGPDQFINPRHIQCDDKYIYVSDGILRRIGVFEINGTFKNVITLKYSVTPDRMVIVNNYLYIGVRSSKYLVIRINLNDYREQEVILDYDNSGHSDIDLRERSTLPILNILNNSLYISLPLTGDIYNINPVNNKIVKRITLHNSITDAFWKRHRQIVKDSREGGFLVPVVIYNIDVWDGRFLIHFNQGEGSATELLSINPDTGEEMGARIISISEGFHHHKVLNDKVLGWVINAEGLVYLYNMPDSIPPQ